MSDQESLKAASQALPKRQEKTEEKAKKLSVPAPASPKIKTKSKSESGMLLFLFEVNENKAKLCTLRVKDNQISVVDVLRYPDMAKRASRREMDWKEFSDWIKKTIEDKRTGQSFQVKVLLMGPGTFVGSLDKPDVSTKELKETITWQVADNLPFEMDETLLKYEERGNKIITSTVSSDFREKVIQSFHTAKIYPSSVTLLPMSYQALVDKQDYLSKQSFLLLHMARHQTYLLYFNKGKFSGMRELPIGGEHITQAMIGTLSFEDQSVNIGYDEAQLLKETLGIPTENLEPNLDEPKNSQLSMRIRPIFDRILNELRNSLARFEKEFPGGKPEKIYVTGGGAQMNGLEDYLETQLGYETTLLEITAVCKNIELSEAQLLGMIFVSSKHFNFGGVEDLLKPRFEIAGSFVKRGVWVVVGIMILLVAFTSFKILVAKAKYKKMQFVFTQMGASDEKLVQLDNYLDRIGKVNIARRSEIKEEPSVGRALREISLLIPRDLQLNEIDFEKAPDPTARLTGVVVLGNRSPDLVMSGFMESLEASSYFRHTKLESRSVSESDEKLIDFSISTQLVSV